MKTSLKQEFKEVLKGVDFPALVYVYETGRIAALNRRAQFLLGGTITNIKNMWPSQAKQMLSPEVLKNGSQVFCQKYIYGRGHCIAIDMELTSIENGEEHIIIALFEQSYKKPFERIFQRKVPRIFWRGRSFQILGSSTMLLLDLKEENVHLEDGLHLIENSGELKRALSEEERVLKDGNSIFGTLYELHGKEESFFAKFSRLALVNKNRTITGVLTIYTQILENEVFQGIIDEVQRENFILGRAAAHGDCIAISWRNGKEGIVDYVSENIIKLGYTPQEFYNGVLTWKDIILPEDYERFLQKDTDTCEKKGIIVTYRIRKADNSVVFVQDETISGTLCDNAAEFRQGCIKVIEEKWRKAE